MHLVVFEFVICLLLFCEVVSVFVNAMGWWVLSLCWGVCLLLDGLSWCGVGVRYVCVSHYTFGGVCWSSLFVSDFGCLCGGGSYDIDVLFHAIVRVFVELADWRLVTGFV